MGDEVDVVAGHALVAERITLINERRDFYRIVAEVSGLGAELPAEVLDNPAVRGALGRLLVGSAAPPAAELTALDSLGDREVRLGGHGVRVAFGPKAERALAEPITVVAARAGLDPAAPPGLLSDPARFVRACEVLQDGVTLAGRAAPALLADLLPHVALLAVLEPGSAGRLGSASTREFPGLVLLPSPASALEAAEALVHESAHQKFFDLAITQDLLGDAAFGAPAYRPSWRPAGAEAWPFEQVFAGWHAYTCLARFWAALRSSHEDRDLDASLLPVAAARAAELADVLLDSGGRLGADAHTLLGALAGRRPTTSPDGDRGPEPLTEPGWLYRRTTGGSRWLAASPGVPTTVYWIPDESSSEWAIVSD